jgi:hypothetical protein
MDSPVEMSAVDQADDFEYSIRELVLSTLF